MKILSPHGYSFRKMGHFNSVSNRSKVQTDPPIKNIHGIKDDHAKSKIGYSHGNIVRKRKACKKIIL